MSDIMPSIFHLQIVRREQLMCLLINKQSLWRRYDIHQRFCCFSLQQTIVDFLVDQETEDVETPRYPQWHALTF
jgi:hypothetical protein